MGLEKHRRVWPDGADRTVTVKATTEQLIRWSDAARTFNSTPHMGQFLARAADFYCARLEARLEMARRLDKDGKL